ncbi:unnamed protein product [Cochlearia groenlandica]
MTRFFIFILIIAMIVARYKCSYTNDTEINRLLKKLNKPALKSIQSPDGDIIDCVHIKNHPIYDHPLFKNHTIQMRPSSYPQGWDNDNINKKGQSIMNQLWTINGKCPKNSIAIRRTTREDILRRKSIKGFKEKQTKHTSRFKPTNSNRIAIHEYATLEIDGIFHGVQTMINVWKPYVERIDEFSLAQIWLTSGPPGQLNTIEFGWQVCPFRYHDDNPRYFIYWTGDDYAQTGCYNLECPGFVHVNQEFALGAAVSHLSTINGQQYHIPVTIWKEPRTGNWWLKIDYHILVGYWPSSLFNHLQNSATSIQFGGEITNVNEGSLHTTTTMGSGRFAEEGYKKASYFRNLEIFDQHDIRRPCDQGVPFMSKARCYNVRLGYDNVVWKNYFYYGGPGRNYNCT